MKVSVIIPALNEEKTIERVVREARKARYLNEILVVDGGSRDRTVKTALKAGAKVIKQSKKKFPGKGIAMMDGVLNASGDILVFIDADIENFNCRFIEKLVEPIVNDEADFVKGYYERKAGRVTEITAKPLVGVFFPEVKLRQPLSGEIAGLRELFLKMKFEEGWGIDIGIVLDAFMLRARIKEVNLGYKEHKMRPTSDLKLMSKEVARVIVERGKRRRMWFLRSFVDLVRKAVNLFYARSYEQKVRMAIFDMDDTLLNGRFIDKLAEAKGLKNEISKILRDADRKHISRYEASKKIAKLLRGIEEKEIRKIASMMHLNNGVKSVVSELKRRGYKIAILSDSYKQVCDVIKDRIGADYVVANRLHIFKNKLTGKLEESNLRCEENCDYFLCKLEGVRLLSKISGVPLKNCVLVGNGLNDAHAMQAVGIRVAFNAPNEVKESANIIIDKNMDELLVYI
jgi:phosphoserine phosphatase SerB